MPGGTRVHDALRWTALAVAIALSSASVARAQDGARIVIEVEPDAAACITSSSLRARVGQWRVQASSGAQRLRVRVDADAMPLRFELLRGDEVVAARAFQLLPQACADRLAAVALVIAVSLEHAGAMHAEPQAGESVAGDEAEPSADAEAPSTTPASTIPPRSAAEAQPASDAEADAAAGARDEDEDDASDAEPSGPATPLDVQVHAGAGVLIGTLPNAVLLFDAGLALRLRALRFGLSGLVTTQSASLLGGGTARAQLIGGRARACLGTLAGAFDLEGCAGLGLGVVSARGENLAAPTGKVHLVWLAPHARLSARFPANSMLSARLALDALVQAMRPELQVSPGGGRPGETDTASVLAITGALEVVLEL